MIDRERSLNINRQLYQSTLDDTILYNFIGSQRKLGESFLSKNPIKDLNDIYKLMKETMRQVLEGGL